MFFNVFMQYFTEYSFDILKAQEEAMTNGNTENGAVLH